MSEEIIKAASIVKTAKGAEVTLTWKQIWKAAEIGVRRHLEALKGGFHDYAPKKDNGWTLHIEGAGGELVLATYLGVPWTGDVNTFKSKPDVADLEVRTRLEHNWDLIVRHRDNTNAVYVLLTGKLPTFHIQGWMHGSEAKNKKYLNNPGGYGEQYFVPQKDLKPMSALPGYIIQP